MREQIKMHDKDIYGLHELKLQQIFKFLSEHTNNTGTLVKLKRLFT